MNLPKTIYCSGMKERFDLKSSCCHSCHDDCDEFGYDMITVKLGEDEEAYVCCATAVAHEDKVKEDLGKKRRNAETTPERKRE